MFCIHMLPARYGDSLWIDYGKEYNPHRVLIDGGLTTTYAVLRTLLLRLLSSQRYFDLIVATHVDADHIEGLITLLADANLKLYTDDFWFNAWRHLSPASKSLLGPVHGEFLSTLIADKRRFPWNQAFKQGPVAIKDGVLPECTLQGGMKLTLLTPSSKALGKLRRVWKREVQKAGLVPGNLSAGRARLYDTPRLLPDALLGDFDRGLEVLSKTESKKDTSIANSSSISFLAEFEGKACLFAADAHPEMLSASIRRLLKSRGQSRLRLDGFKVAHHGGNKNFSHELAELLDCQQYLFSSNGERYGHPDRETIARVLTGKQSHCWLAFNYRSEANQAWDDERLKDAYNYSVKYPESNQTGLKADL